MSEENTDGTDTDDPDGEPDGETTAERDAGAGDRAAPDRVDGAARDREDESARDRGNTARDRDEPVRNRNGSAGDRRDAAGDRDEPAREQDDPERDRGDTARDRGDAERDRRDRGDDDRDREGSARDRRDRRTERRERRAERRERTGRTDRRDREEGGTRDGGEGDPLDVTEDDLDAGELDEEDLETLVSLLEEADAESRSRSGQVGRGEMETLLSVFDDAGVETGNLDVEDLEERFEESMKVARMLVRGAANTGEYAGLAGIRAGSRMAEAAFTSESPRDLLEETTSIARDELGRLGLPVGDSRNEGSNRSNGQRRRPGDEEGGLTVEDLRDHGDLLLDLAADVDHEEPFHPAYRHIVTQLAADEARVLRLLATEGPQPALDVYERGFIPIGGTLVDDGLTMVATDAGLRHGERSDIYLDNLERLGLVVVSDTMLENLEQYRVLRAQPNVERAVESARNPKTTRRSVRLTDLGVDFCDTVFRFELDDHYRTGDED